MNRVTKLNETANLPRIEFEDIVSGQGQLNKDIYQKKNNKKGIEFEPGDILFGKLRPYLKNWLYASFNGIAVGDFWVLRSNGTRSTFIYPLLQTSRYQYIANLSSGTKMPRSDWKTVSKTTFRVPTQIEEQSKIGTFLKQIDNTIILHQRKLEKLQKLKKAALQSFFPKKDELMPKVRFANFSGLWKQRKLAKVTKITMGQSPSSKNYTNNPKDYILVQGNADMKNNRVTPRVWTTQITKVADKYDLILTVRAPVGEIGKTDYEVVLGRGVAAIKGSEFIFQQLQKMKVNNYWRKFSTGSTFESINSSNVKEANIMTTKNKEEKKIGFFLSQLDNSIVLHQQKLEKLQNCKKAFLQKMFI